MKIGLKKSDMPEELNDLGAHIASANKAHGRFYPGILSIVAGFLVLCAHAEAAVICYGSNARDGLLVDWPNVSFPEDCRANMALTEHVTVAWDISPKGYPTNVSVVESSNSCFDKSLIENIEKRRYGSIDQCPTDASRKGLTTTMTFHRGDPETFK